MFKNYMTTAIRNLLRHKQYTLINIFGLAVGLAACMLILLYVNFELSYDRWIPENDRVVRLGTNFFNDAGEPNGQSEVVPPVTAPLFGEQLDEIELFTRFLHNDVAIAVDGRAFEQQITASDPGVFELMGIKLLAGDPATALSDPESLILSKSDAERIFGTTDILGRVVKVDGQHNMKITGVMPDWPAASDIQVKALAPMGSPMLSHMPWLQTEWGSFWGPTYARLKEGVTLDQLAASMNALARRIGPSRRFQEQIDKGLTPTYVFYAEPAVEAHLKGADFDPGRGSMATLISAGVVAFLILVIAAINVSNLGAMLALKRVREVAVRKALGAEGHHLMLQVLVESISLTLLSMLIGVVFAEVLLPTFSELMNRPLNSSLIYSPGIMAALVLGALFVGVLSGLYPALVAMRFRPVDYLNGIKPQLGNRFRNILIVLQFAATIALLATCLVVFLQARYAAHRDSGFDSAQLVEISGIERPVVLERQQAFRDALARIPGVEAVAASHGMPGHDYNNQNGLTRSDGKMVVVRRFAVSEDLLPMLGVEPIAGRLFDKNRPADAITAPDRGASGAIIINDLALKELEFATAEEAIGQEVTTWGDFRSEIIGVVPNLRTRSAKAEASPTYYWIGPHEYRHIVLRVSRADMASTLDKVDQAWREFFPDLPVRRQFVDDAFAKYYDTERRQGWLLLFSASVMTVIAVMGLYGLAGLATERRAKEIGIRKVLGAKSRNIVKLLLWQFSLPVLLANVIAWPLAWWGLSRWLESFIDRIGLTPWPFLAAGLLVLGVAWATIIGHTLRVARGSPIKALRYE
ncbi:FtsX-like permease family protein [Kordiimonas lipolytica]|uniref:FtsX-like permease family protein n=1 Tax=Kordiimonas lipolytica TaxID=1662421 RepID=A0ABV8UF52_9PROT|nr:FtsX-like permease family protein [Kordiimonas lipolytica]